MDADPEPAEREEVEVMVNQIRTLVSIYEHIKEDNDLAMKVAGMSKSTLAVILCDTVTTLLRLDRELRVAQAEAEYCKREAKEYSDLLAGFDPGAFKGEDLQRLNDLLTHMEEEYL